MALYILNDPNIQMYIPLKTQYEISMIKALNRKRIPTKTLRQTTDTDFMTEDPQAVLLIPELNTCLTELILFCNKNNIPVIVLHSANTLVPFLTFSGIYGHSYTDERAILQYCISAGKSGWRFSASTMSPPTATMPTQFTTFIRSSHKTICFSAGTALINASPNFSRGVMNTTPFSAQTIL